MIDWFLTVLGLHCCARGLSLIEVWGFLIVVAFLVVEHRLLVLWLQLLRRVGSRTRAQLPLGMWDLPGAGMELMSLALQGRFLTTWPPGKPLFVFDGIFRFFTCSIVSSANTNSFISSFPIWIPFTFFLILWLWQGLTIHSGK